MGVWACKVDVVDGSGQESGLEDLIRCLSLCSLCLCGEIFSLCFLLRTGARDLLSRGVPRWRF
jgi:hypothetical protein